MRDYCTLKTLRHTKIAIKSPQIFVAERNVKGKPMITAESIPIALARPNHKCHSEDGLICERKSHAHERIVVSTTALLNHAQVCRFSRSLAIMNQNDGLPNCELWSLRDLKAQHAASRGQLVQEINHQLYGSLEIRDLLQTQIFLFAKAFERSQELI